MRLARAELFKKLLVTLPAASLLSPAPPASALIGEVIGPGFTQADDKSWDFTLPSAAWELAGEAPWRSEHPVKLFHVSGSRSGGSATFDLSVAFNGGAKFLDELGPPRKYGEKVAPSDATLTSAKEVSTPIKGATLLDLRYDRGAAGSAAYRVAVKQGRTFTMAVSLPASPSEAAQAEAAALLESFKAFPINFICAGQSNKGQTPAAGSCY